MEIKPLNGKSTIVLIDSTWSGVMNGWMGSAMVKSAEGTQLKSIIISFDLINLIQETKHETQINSFSVSPPYPEKH